MYKLITISVVFLCASLVFGQVYSGLVLKQSNDLVEILNLKTIELKKQCIDGLQKTEQELKNCKEDFYESEVANQSLETEIIENLAILDTICATHQQECDSLMEKYGD